MKIGNFEVEITQDDCYSNEDYFELLSEHPAERRIKGNSNIYDLILGYLDSDVLELREVWELLHTEAASFYGYQGGLKANEIWWALSETSAFATAFGLHPDSTFEDIEDHVNGLDLPFQNLLRKFIFSFPFIHLVDLYEHSGISLSLHSSRGEWDKSRGSAIVWARTEQDAEGLLDYYNNLYAGEIYHYSIEWKAPDDGQFYLEREVFVDSCGGFVGYDHKKSGLMEYVENAVRCTPEPKPVERPATVHLINVGKGWMEAWWIADQSLFFSPITNETYKGYQVVLERTLWD